jgi:hypothetical protein
VNPDQLAELEEERRFLLRSITDLDREHLYGDVDDNDYRTLRDGYTARAASVLRAIDDWPRRGLAAAPAPAEGVHRLDRRHLAVACVAGWLVARTSGQRPAGSGDHRVAYPATRWPRSWPRPASCWA